MIINSRSSSGSTSAYASAVASRSLDRSQQGAKSYHQTSAKGYDSVNLSDTSTSYSNYIANAARFFPVRPGMNADALILGASQPGAASSSKDKTFSEVADDARTRLDKKYEYMASSGTPFNDSDQDRNALMGELDRRSLNSIATDKTGLFTTEERYSAKALMQQQSRLASGFYSGPAEEKSNWKDPFINNPAGRARAALDFLNNLSIEEKNAPEWLPQHRALEAALSQAAHCDIKEPTPGSIQTLSEILAGEDSRLGHFNNLAEILQKD